MINSLTPLLREILFGDYGIVTMTPLYLLTVLLPIMLILEYTRAFLFYLTSKFSTPLLARVSHNLVYLIGLGCTTAALLYSGGGSGSNSSALSHRLILLLVIPCSAQLACIAAFAATSGIGVFLPFLILWSSISAIIIFAVKARGREEAGRPLRHKSGEARGRVEAGRPLRQAVSFVAAAAPSFFISSILVSILSWQGFFQSAGQWLGPLLNGATGLPAEAAGVLILSVIKRDFGAASIIALTKVSSLNDAQLVTLLLMMTFTVPCFNSTVVLFRTEKPYKALLLWLGSLVLSASVGCLCGFAQRLV